MDSPSGRPLYRDPARDSRDRFRGEGKITSLLILSQVVLSFQFPFAVLPLVRFTSGRVEVGEIVNSPFTVVVVWVVAEGNLFFDAELL